VCGQVEHTNVYNYNKSDDLSIPLISPKMSVDKMKKINKSPIGSKVFPININVDENIPGLSVANIKIPNNNIEEKLPATPVP
jgi:hypothetical protein